MIKLPPIEHEQLRVDMVRSFGLLNESRPPQHEEIAALARSLAHAQWGLVTLIDSERLWLTGGIADLGADHCRWESFCTHVIADPEHLLWVEDAREDFRFAKLPSVLSEQPVRFYAGAPVLVNGYAVGTVCVFDSTPRTHDAVLTRQLNSLAKIVGEDLAARHRSQSLRGALEASADAVIDCDNRGQIASWSKGAEQLFGFSALEAVGSSIAIIIPDDQKAAHSRGFAHWRQHGGGRLGRRIELAACRKDGTSVDIDLWMSVVHQRGIPFIHANVRDISQRKAHALALEAATREAQAASEAKSMFLANMSHELRTPLNGVIGVVDLLDQTPLSDHQRELTRIIKSSSDHLGRLIGDILDLGRIEAGELAIVQTQMLIADVVDDIRNSAELAAQEKGLAVVVDIAPDTAAPVLGDPMRLKQVLTNLVSNAIKFTGSGAVSVSVTCIGDDYRFEVRDTGIGFAEDQREAVFGRFQQADGTITRRFGGSGLGLAISRDLVIAMGGKIDCRSEQGRGASFWFTVPLPQARELQVLAEEAAVDVSSAGRALVVDDNATNRRVAELLLQAIGLDAVCVEDGNQAVEAFMVGTYDVILMDMMMPVMDGIAATMAIRDLESRGGLPRTAIIMLTANILPQHIQASLDAGADAHLPKPLGANALLTALSEVLGSDEVQPEFAVSAA